MQLYLSEPCPGLAEAVKRVNEADTLLEPIDRKELASAIEKFHKLKSHHALNVQQPSNLYRELSLTLTIYTGFGI